MNDLDADLERARRLSVSAIADAIESIGFECTQCGACCRAVDCHSTGHEAFDGDGQSPGHDVSESGDATGEQADAERDTEPHTATVFPDEIRQLQQHGDYDWRDVARPMPYGLEDGPEGPEGQTLEWALQTDDCGDCTFFSEDEEGEGGACTVYGDRPLICQTYPFSIAMGGASQPLGEPVDRSGLVRAHECEGLGRDISRAEAEELAETLKRRTVRELEEAIELRDSYEPTDTEGVVVHDSEGPKRPDGTPLDER